MTPPLGHLLSEQRKISSAVRYANKRPSVQDNFAGAASFNENQGTLEVFVPSTILSSNVGNAQYNKQGNKNSNIWLLSSETRKALGTSDDSPYSYRTRTESNAIHQTLISARSTSGSLA